MLIQCMESARILIVHRFTNLEGMAALVATAPKDDGVVELQRDLVQNLA